MLSGPDGLPRGDLSVALPYARVRLRAIHSAWNCTSVVWVWRRALHHRRTTPRVAALNIGGNFDGFRDGSPPSGTERGRPVTNGATSARVSVRASVSQFRRFTSSRMKVRTTGRRGGGERTLERKAACSLRGGSFVGPSERGSRSRRNSDRRATVGRRTR